MDQRCVEQLGFQHAKACALGVSVEGSAAIEL